MPSPRRQAISAAYLSHKDSVVTFVSRFRPRQQALSLTLDVGDGDVRLEVMLKQARETHTGEFICQGEITEGLESLAYPQVPSSVARFARDYPRTAVRLRALSPGLPNFRALSVDLSQGGLKLETEDRLVPGSQLKMSLDLDIPDQEPVPLSCRVVWCQAVDRKFVVGLQFLQLEPWIPPLLESFQSWLEGTGLKPKPYTAPPELEFPEPEVSREEEARPPAGSISNVSLAQQQLELILAWTRGEVFRVVFSEVLVLKDNRGVEGAAFYDALDLEESKLKTEALRMLPVSLEEESRELYHYQFLNRRDRPILEVLCKQAADHQQINGDS